MPARDFVLEQEILGNPRRLSEGLRYAKDVIHGRWTEWEEKVLRRAVMRPLLLFVCVRYAVTLIKGTWAELEAVIFHLAGTCPTYAPILSNNAAGTDPTYSSDPLGYVVTEYAREVIHGPWPSFESLVLHGKCRLDIAVTYTAQIRVVPWGDLENLLLGAAPDDAMVALARYASEVRNGTWSAAETYFLNHPSNESLPYALYYYARHAVKRELPAALHAAMMLVTCKDPKNDWVKSYFDFLTTLQR